MSIFETAGLIQTHLTKELVSRCIVCILHIQELTLFVELKKEQNFALTSEFLMDVRSHD